VRVRRKETAGSGSMRPHNAHRTQGVLQQLAHDAQALRSLRAARRRRTHHAAPRARRRQRRRRREQAATLQLARVLQPPAHVAGQRTRGTARQARQARTSRRKPAARLRAASSHALEKRCEAARRGRCICLPHATHSSFPPSQIKPIGV
jgi:hypothetical protein